MLKKITAILFIFIVFSVLIALHFSGPKSVLVMITDTQGISEHEKNEVLKRGQFIKTEKGEFLALQIGETIQVVLDENTTIELKRTFIDERTIVFTRGRIVVSSTDEAPILIETNKIKSVIQNATASFVNYDFLDTVSLIPLPEPIPLMIKGVNETNLVPIAINIHELNPIPFEPIEFNKNAGVYAAFYQWAEQIKIKSL